MKPYRILASFKGSQTGSDSQDFTVGTLAELSDSLAAIALQHGWAAPAEEPEPSAAKAVDIASSGEASEPTESQEADSPEVPEAKSEGEAPENKAIDGAPENKARGRKKKVAGGEEAS